MVVLRGWALFGPRHDRGNMSIIPHIFSTRGLEKLISTIRDRGLRCNVYWCVLGQFSLISGEVAKQYIERCVRQYLMDTVQSSNLLLVELGVFGLEHKEFLELSYDEIFHPYVREKYTRKKSAYQMRCFRACGYYQLLLYLAHRRRSFCPR